MHFREALLATVSHFFPQTAKHLKYNDICEKHAIVQ